MTAADYDKRTPLMLAVCEGQVGVVAYMLAQAEKSNTLKFALNYKDVLDNTPFDDAEREKEKLSDEAKENGWTDVGKKIDTLEKEHEVRQETEARKRKAEREGGEGEKGKVCVCLGGFGWFCRGHES